MGLPQTNEPHRFTYGEYRTWPDDERWELIDGVAYDMSPAPSMRHQQILQELFGIFWLYFKDKTCEVFIAPFDVRLPAPGQDDDATDTVVQPDLSVFCDPARLDKKGGKGAPDLVVEVVSPYTAAKDLRAKMALYEKHRVKEYWVVDPANGIVQLYSIEEQGGFSKPLVFTWEDTIQDKLFPGLAIPLSEVFGEDEEHRKRTPSPRGR